MSNDFSTRRFSRAKLYTGGRILHIVRRKKTELEKKTVSPTFEMRWSTPENFTELKVRFRKLVLI